MPLEISDKDESHEMLLIYEISRQFRFTFDRRVKHLNLTKTQWRVLSVIRRNPKIWQNQIASFLDVEPITIVRTLDRMEKSGWIKRKTDPLDKRANQIILTKKVDNILAEMIKTALVSRKDVLEGFSEKEYKNLLNYLNRIKLNLGKML